MPAESRASRTIRYHPAPTRSYFLSITRRPATSKTSSATSLSRGSPEGAAFELDVMRVEYGHPDVDLSMIDAEWE